MKQMEDKSWKDMLSKQEINPDPELWQNIEGTLKKKNTIFYRKRYFSAAAVLLALFSSGYLLNLQFENIPSKPQANHYTSTIEESNSPRIQQSLIPKLPIQKVQNKKTSIQFASLNTLANTSTDYTSIKKGSTSKQAAIVVSLDQSNEKPINESNHLEEEKKEPILLAHLKHNNTRKEISQEGSTEEDWTIASTDKRSQSNWMLSSNMSLPDKGGLSSNNSIKTGIITSGIIDGMNGLEEALSQRKYTYTSRIQMEMIGALKIYKRFRFVTGIRYFLENGNHDQENRNGAITNSQSIGDYHYQQISLPIGLRFEMIKKSKFSSYLQSTYSFSLSQKYSQELVRDDLSKLYSKEHLSLGVGVEYKVLDWLGLFAQPSIIQGLDNKNDQRTSLKTGLNIHF